MIFNIVTIVTAFLAGCFVGLMVFAITAMWMLDL